MPISHYKPPSLKRPPRYKIAPDVYDVGWGDLAIDFANQYLAESKWEKMYDWQEDIIRCWMSVDKNGIYSHDSCGVDLPRQQGKTKWLVCDRMLTGAIFKGEKIRYSAQRVDVMLETFEVCHRTVGDPESPKEKGRNQDLWEFCQPKINFTNGHQSIKFKGGGAIYFVSRSRDSGRGNTVDVCVFDEAQTLTDAQLADALPGQSSAPTGNPQTIYVGTPPNMERGDSGEAFGRIRKEAINSEHGFCWFEWSVAEIGDIFDKSRWYATNPALGECLLERSVEKELGTLSELAFAIERLCYWAPTANAQVIDANLWDSSYREVAPPDTDIEKMCLGIKFAPDALQVCVSVAALGKDDVVHCELVKDEDVPLTTENGIEWLVDFIYERREKYALFAIDGATGAGELYERLLRKRDARGKLAINKNQLHLMRTADVVTATSMVTNALAEGKLTHRPDQTLDASAKTSIKRKIGQEGIGFGGDSCAIESMAAALFAVRTTKNNPQRKRKWRK